LLAAVGLTVAVVLLSIRFAGSLIILQPHDETLPISFNKFDDFQAYIVYPLKMLETGSMGAEPFSVRRTPSVSFGGGAFLQTFVLAALPVQSLRLLDVGLGTILIVGLLWSYTSQLRTTLVATAFAILVFLEIPPPFINTTAVLIPAALFFSLLMVFEFTDSDASRMSRAVLVGVHIAALCVLKTSLIPAALAFAGVQSCFAVVRASSKTRAALNCLLWFAFAGMAILPWMLDARRWTGTFMPGSLAAYYAHPTRVAAIQAATGWTFLIQHLRELPRAPYVTLAVLSGLLLVKQAKGKNRDGFWSLLATVALGTVGITLAVAGTVNDIPRFIYAFLIIALLAALAQVSAAIDRYDLRSARIMVGIVAIAVTGVLVLETARRSASMYKSSLLTIRSALHGETLISPTLAAKHREMQSVLPPSVTVLARMDYPFLFDFRRNKILIIDIPGSASLAPGMPFFQGSEAVATYLTSHGIHYVAYDYATEASTPRRGTLAALVNDTRYASAMAVVRLIFDFAQNLEELGRTRERVYDDGTAFVLDLSKPARSIAANDRHMPSDTRERY